MGLLPVPAAGQGFAHAHQVAAEVAEVVPVWGRPSAFWELADDLRGEWGQTFVEQHIRGNGMVPLAHLSFIDAGLTLKVPPGLEGATLQDPAWRERYTQAALDVVRAGRPALLSLGNEVNRWYEAHGAGPANPNSFVHYVSLYEQTYDRVKALSPDTLVFCTFSREVVSELREARLAQALSLFDPERLDLVVLTSYPWAVQGTNLPSQVPSDYYLAPLRAAGLEHKPFGFSELAWSALPAVGGEAAQARLLREAATRLSADEGLKLELLMWPWMHDLDDNDATGLRTHAGQARLAWQDWTRLARQEAAPTRAASIPADVPKGTPDNDLYPPVLHAAEEYEPCVPLPGPVNTAGLEDSPFVAPDGAALYFTFTPDARTPHNEQLLDGVTGIWRAARVGQGWGEPERVRLAGEVSLDGCPVVDGDLLWFCSIRAGNLGEADLYTASRMDSLWTNWTNAGPHVNGPHDFGEVHLSADRQTLWLHRTAAAGGFGGHDLWVSTWSGERWGDPVNLGPAVNNERDQAQPFVTRDGAELWFTSPSAVGLPGPATWRARWLGSEWSAAEEVVGSFAGEPNLDADGNLYVVHHFFDRDMGMLEADIYVCRRR